MCQSFLTDPIIRKIARSRIFKVANPTGLLKLQINGIVSVSSLWSQVGCSWCNFLCEGISIALSILFCGEWWAEIMQVLLLEDIRIWSQCWALPKGSALPNSEPVMFPTFPSEKIMSGLLACHEMRRSVLGFSHRGFFPGISLTYHSPGPGWNVLPQLWYHCLGWANNKSWPRKHWISCTCSGWVSISHLGTGCDSFSRSREFCGENVL